MVGKRVYIEELVREWGLPYAELEEVFLTLGIVIKEGWVTSRERVWAHQVILGQPIELVRSRRAAQLERDGHKADTPAPGHDSTLKHCECSACERPAAARETPSAGMDGAIVSGPERRFQQF